MERADFHQQGVTPDFNQELTGSHSITITCSVCIALAVLFAAARLYAKVRIIRKASIDDCENCALLASRLISVDAFWVSLPILLVIMGMLIYRTQALDLRYATLLK
jgi:hypothetical protein